MSVRESADGDEVQHIENLADRLLLQASAVLDRADDVHADAFERGPSDQLDGGLDEGAVEELAAEVEAVSETVEVLAERAE